MSDESKRTPVGIRINRDLLHEAKIAAVREKLTLGRWLEDAILGKIQMTKMRDRWD
ncbi:hypothetical protein ACFLVR_03825 [Chloroflexota bacterium]